MSAYETISVDRTDSVATVRLDNLEARNALDFQLADELLSAVTTLGEDQDVRCLVLTHAGEFFNIGANLGELSGDETDAPHIRQLAGRLHEVVIQLHQARTPVVCGVDGVAAGAGFSLTLVPDMLVLSDEARLEFAYPQLGLTGDGGVTYFLPRLVGLRTARELVLQGEPISPEQAVEIGLANEVVPSEEFDDRLDELAGDIAAGPTGALAETMRLLTESHSRDLEGQLAAETDAMASAINSTDYQRGYEAFFGDGDPEFVGY